MKNTSVMIQMFAGKYKACKKNASESEISFEKREEEYKMMLPKSQILDVLLACFPKEAEVSWREVWNYNFVIHDSEARLNKAWYRCDGDANAYANYAKTIDIQRTTAHNSALAGGERLNKLCDDLNIDHLFTAEISREPGKRAVAGDEFCALVAFRNTMKEAM